MTAKTCAHAACSCAVEPEELFCSPTCRREADRSTRDVEGCDCGHQECEGSTHPEEGRPLAEGGAPAP